MRKIKFRVWDPEMKKMDIIEKIFEHVDLMQYTGVDDVFGEEIYEGDILQDEFGERYFVKFFNCEFVAEGGGEVHALEDVANMANVIGNIYENPEIKIWLPLEEEVS